MSMDAWIDAGYALLMVFGMGAITVLTRCFFLLPEQEWRLPTWLQRGLRYAPLAALVAVLAPELVMRDGQLLNTLADARLPAALVALAVHAWKRSMLLTISSGMAVFLPLHIGLGW